MVSTTPAKQVEITATLPDDLLREIDAIAEAEQLTRDEVLAAGAKRYISGLRRWREVQAIGSERARALGLRTEDDVEEYLDSLPD